MKKKITEYKYEIIIIILFLLMSITTCPLHSINFDEFYTMYWCKSSFSLFFHEVLHDTSPFLYYYMIRPFTILTGHNIFMARLFSIAALFIILLIGPVFIKKNWGKKAAVFYLSIMYLNPFMLQKSTEIRMYVWASVFTLLSGVFCYELLHAPSSKNWVSFTLFSLLASYTHYYSVLSAAFLYLGLLLYFIITHKNKEVQHWLIYSVITIIAYFPFLLVAVFQIRESGGDWIDAPSSKLAPLKELFYSDIKGSEYLYLMIMSGFSLFALAAFLRKKTAELYWSVLCCSALWGITVLGIIFGMFVKPIMLSRYLIMPTCLLFLGISPLLKYLHRYLFLILYLPIVIIGGVRYKHTLDSLKKDLTVHTINFAEENIEEGDKIVLISGDDYLYNCAEYFIPQAELCYTGKFSPDLFRKEKKDDVFWFFDTGNYIDRNELEQNGLIVEDFGQYQFRYLHMQIYKIY